MALFTISANARTNQPPDAIGDNTLSTTYGNSLVLTEANFTTETIPAYSDPEGDAMSKMKAITITGVGTGDIKLSGVPIAPPDEVTLADIQAGNLIYVPDNTVVTAYSFILTFDLSDAGSSGYSGLTPGTLTIDVSAQANLAPTAVGNNSKSILYGSTTTFTAADFTSGTTPPYSDPEGDGASKLKVTSLPASGTLQLDGVNVTLNQEITFADISAGKFKYIADLSGLTGYSAQFTFEVSDTGSGTFVG